MGADRVVVCYGIRYLIGIDGELPDDQLQAFDQNSDTRIVAARRAGLKSYFGRVTDGGEYFLLVGSLLGPFGVEGQEREEVSDSRLSEIMQRTREALSRAGLDGMPSLHIQLEAQY